MADFLRVSRTVDARAEAVFDVLADPAHHAAIDGTGWVCEPLGSDPVTGTGQVFGMAMYHANHPDGAYRMHNRVEVFDRPHAVAWRPGQYSTDGTLEFGGWTYRHDIAPLGDGSCEVTLTYDWSEVPPPIREYISFPPVGEDHFRRSLDHLAALATDGGATI